jgi:chromosome segregation ATPase|tara:strand:- start:3985 stop:4293 length:309 start_codon:yes stop_codon:yes gene_type:complete
MDKEKIVNYVKKNIFIIPVVASIIIGTFTGIKYIVTMTDSIHQSEQQIVNLKRDLKVEQDKIIELSARLGRAEGTWEMAENLYRVLADQVREHEYDIKDLNR